MAVDFLQFAMNAVIFGFIWHLIALWVQGSDLEKAMRFVFA